MFICVSHQLCLSKLVQNQAYNISQSGQTMGLWDTIISSRLHQHDWDLLSAAYSIMPWKYSTCWFSTWSQRSSLDESLRWHKWHSFLSMLYSSSTLSQDPYLIFASFSWANLHPMSLNGHVVLLRKKLQVFVPFVWISSCFFNLHFKIKVLLQTSHFFLHDVFLSCGFRSQSIGNFFIVRMFFNNFLIFRKLLTQVWNGLVLLWHPVFKSFSPVSVDKIVMLKIFSSMCLSASCCLWILMIPESRKPLTTFGSMLAPLESLSAWTKTKNFFLPSSAPASSQA
jgi:hypothetical protein